MKPLLSIILPVYNAGPFLDKCRESILNQGLTKDQFEVICVNDGSTDDSLSRLIEWQDIDDSVIIIDKENMGIGEARNTGIFSSHGEWILFLDPDDLIENLALRRLFEIYDLEGIDVIQFGRRSFYSDSEVILSSTSWDIRFKGHSFDFLNYNGIEPFCTNYLYRRSFLVDNDITFKYKVMEDFPFITEVFSFNPKFLSIPCRIYYYYVHAGSATNIRTRSYLRQLVFQQVSSFEEIFNICKRFPESIQKRRFSDLQQKLLLRLLRRIHDAHLSYREFACVARRLKDIELIPINKSYSMYAYYHRWLLNSVFAFPIFYIFLRPLYSLIGYKTAI